MILIYLRYCISSRFVCILFLYSNYKVNLKCIQYDLLKTVSNIIENIFVISKQLFNKFSFENAKNEIYFCLFALYV